MHKALLTLGAVAAIAAAAPAERVVRVGDALPVTINGVPAQLRVDPAAPGLPLAGGALVERAGLRCSGLLCFGLAYRIGGERVGGRSAVARFGWGDAKPGKRRIGWLDRQGAVEGDGAIGPAGLPDPVVRFVLGPSRPGERTVALPMEDGGLFGDWGPTRALLTLGEDRIAVRFDPTGRRSLATAAAAVAIARAHGGTMTEERDRQVILFGVDRPVRVMTLARPLHVGPLSLHALGVRTTDGAGANTIPDADADPSEVVVTAKGKKTYMVLSLGADQLSRCSALVFDKPARQVRLTCA